MKRIGWVLMLASGAAMAVDQPSTYPGCATRGLSVPWGAITPLLRLEYQQDFSGRTTAEMGYADLPGGPVCGVAASRFDRNRFVAGFGALFDTDSGWNRRLEYRGQVSSDGDDHGLQMNVQKQF